MGTGGSRQKPIGNGITSKQASQKKVVAIGAFSSHLSSQRTAILRRRTSLAVFTAKMKRENQLAPPVTTIWTKRPKSGEKMEQEKSDREAVLLQWSTRRVLPGSVCSLCSVPFEPFQEYKGAMCRVCGKTFHISCLYNCQECHKSILKATHYADTRIGWSCFVCSDLTTLLQYSEVLRLTEQFESCDLNQDGTVTLNEYLRHKAELVEKLEGRQLSHTDETYLKHKFKFMDMDGDQRLDWWEFLVNESIQFIEKRDPGKLVSLLTPREVNYARSLFEMLDRKKNGEVSHLQINNVCKEWYKSINSDNDSDKDSGIASASHLPPANRRLPTIKPSDTGVVTWDEFIRGQAVSIITSRPNKIYY